MKISQTVDLTNHQSIESQLQAIAENRENNENDRIFAHAIMRILAAIKDGKKQV